MSAPVPATAEIEPTVCAPFTTLTPSGIDDYTVMETVGHLTRDML